MAALLFAGRLLLLAALALPKAEYRAPQLRRRRNRWRAPLGMGTPHADAGGDRRHPRLLQPDQDRPVGMGAGAGAASSDRRGRLFAGADRSWRCCREEPRAAHERATTVLPGAGQSVLPADLSVQRCRIG